MIQQGESELGISFLMLLEDESWNVNCSGIHLACRFWKTQCY